MIYGVILLLLTGLCWIGIGVTVSRAAEERLDMNFIQFGASALIAAAAIGAILFQPPLTGTPLQQLLICGAVLLAGMSNYLMLNLMRCAMVLGDNGAVWGITQSALLCPFVMGMLFFRVAPTWNRIIGLLLVLGGIFLFSRAVPVHGKRSRKWLWPAFGAFAASGLAQCFANLPSYWGEIGMSSELRACLVQFGTISLFALTVPFERRKLRPKGCWKAILLLSVVQILALFFFFYRGLNIVAEQGGGSIGYPIAQGSCIAFFLLYNRFIRHEPCSTCVFWAFPLICGGIVLMAL